MSAAKLDRTIQGVYKKRRHFNHRFAEASNILGQGNEFFDL